MFVNEPPESSERDSLYESDIESHGFVWTITKLWAWNPLLDRLVHDFMDAATDAGGLSFRDRGILVSATASTIDNSGCALAWGNRLSNATDVDLAVGVLSGDEPPGATERDRVLAGWARKVAGKATATTEEDVDELRRVGLTDQEIHAITTYIAIRIAYSTVNDALGAPLDTEETRKYPDEVVAAVDFGRPPT